MPLYYQDGKIERKSKRRDKQQIEIIEVVCPSCKHDRMWRFNNPNSNYEYKCTRCDYISLRAL